MKKKAVSMILCMTMALSLAACGSQSASGQADSSADAQTQTDTGEDTQADAGADDTADTAGSGTGAADAAGSETEASGSTAVSDETGSNILIAYFTVPETDGTDAVSGASRVVADGQVFGNTEYVAQLIQQETGGDLFAIETVQEYPGSHDPLLEFAYNEKADNARPELATQIENLDDYDTIFLGYPNWNADLPMPLYTFLESYDFSGKTIIPFTTHGGSGFSRTLQTIADLQPDAALVEDGLSIPRGDVPDAQSEVTDWVAGLGL